MATYTPEDLISHDLSCPICFEDYDILCRQRAPKLLLCLHTFCFGCAQRLWQPDGTLECSLCRTVHSGVALNELFDNLVILEHLRKECEEQDLELARRLDTEMRKRISRNTESTAEVIDLTSPKVEQRNEERHILNRVPAPQPVRAIVQLQGEDDEEEEEDEDDVHSVSGSGHHHMFDSDGTVEEEEDEEEEEESDNDGHMDDFLNQCIDDMVDAVDDAVQVVEEAVDGIDDAVDGIDDAVDGIDEGVGGIDNAVGGIDDAADGIDDAADGIDDAADGIDDAVDGIDDDVDQIDDVVERPHFLHQHHDQDNDNDNDDSTSSNDDNDDDNDDDDDDGEHEDVMRQMMVTIPWINHLPPHIQSDEEDNDDGRHIFDDCYEEDDVEEEEEEEDRWHSASDEVTSPQWVDDDYSMDDDAPDSPNLLDWLVL